MANHQQLGECDGDAKIEGKNNETVETPEVDSHMEGLNLEKCDTTEQRGNNTSH